jgi:hypothetical protein
MNSQLNKLTAFILPIILLFHSTLQAAGCPCCVVRSCLSITSEHSAVLQKSCCRMAEEGAERTHQGTCCSRANRQSTTDSPAGLTTVTPNDSGDCDCCIDLPGLATAPTVPPISFAIAFITPVALDILWKPVATPQRLATQLLPVETNRRLAILSCWRK